MAQKIVKDVTDVVVTANELVSDISKFIEENIIKIDVKITEGPMLIEARKIIADGLRNMAKLVEDPTQPIKWVDIKKPKK
ncbi:MAG TPA: hypothetical protein VI790_02150 [Candidatus Nanoarchaeia archaeon]|nr:hypothetical protein [Candidatus Nanoarchaeia archaeon]